MGLAAQELHGTQHRQRGEHQQARHCLPRYEERAIREAAYSLRASGRTFRGAGRLVHFVRLRSLALSARRHRLRPVEPLGRQIRALDCEPDAVLRSGLGVGLLEKMAANRQDGFLTTWLAARTAVCGGIA